jgi:hypothetical protein
MTASWQNFQDTDLAKRQVRVALEARHPAVE